MTQRQPIEGGGAVFIEPSPPGDLPLISLSLSLFTGSTWDPSGQDGLLRLMLQLLRRGTRTRSSRDIDLRIDRLGAELGIEVAPTSSTLHAQVLSRNIEPLVELLGEVLAEPAFDREELERLRRELQADLLEARDNDRGICNLWFRRTVFGEHPYSRGAAGRLSTLAALGGDEVRAAHQAVLRRGNLVLGFSGDIDRERALALATKLLAQLPAGEVPAVTLAEPTEPEGRQLIFVDKPERTQCQVLIGKLGTDPHDPDHTALSLANTAFGGTFTARLMREVRSKRGWSYGAYARLPIDRRRHAFSMWTFPAADQVADCIKLQLKLWQRWHEAGISQRELRFFKNYLSRSYAFEIDTPHKRLTQALDIELLGLPADYHEGYLERLAAVTREEANEAVQRRLDPRSCVIVVVGSKELSLEPVKKALGALDRISVIPFDTE